MIFNSELMIMAAECSSVMAAKYNLNQFNSYKNIAIKEMWEKKSKDKTRTQDVTVFGFNNVYVSETLNL
jgi:hypothetical protein